MRYLIALLFITIPRTAYADTVHLKTPSSVVTDGGSKLRLPAGYFVDEPVWLSVDKEFRRLQESETRTLAENKALRSRLDTWSPGWITLATSFAVGAIAGGYLVYRVSN